MIEIVFDLNQVITKIQGNIKEPFKNVIDRYIQKSNYKRDELCFIGNGEIINENNIIENIMSQDDKNNNRMNILVEIIIKDENGNKIIKSKDIILKNINNNNIKDKKEEKKKEEDSNTNINNIKNNNNSHNIYVINNYFEDKKNKINSLNNTKIGLWKDGKRYDRNGIEIKKGGKQKLSYLDRIGKGRLVDTIAIESFKEYNLIEEVSDHRKNNCCFVF